MKTSLILPVVIASFLTALARTSAFAGLAEDTAAAIRTEALRSNFDPIGRPLPLVSSWGRQMPPSLPMEQIGLVEQGHFYVPVFWNKFVGTPEIWEHDRDRQWDSAHYQPEFKRAAELKLPVVFVTITGIIHAHESLLARPPYSDLPPDQNPMAFDAQGQPLKVLSPFGPVEHWRDLGRRWAAAERMKKVQEWYPDPPLIMFLSNNEMGVLEWYHAERDARCPPNLRTTKNSELKCKAVTDGFIERYRALQGAWKEGLSESWRKAATFVGYNAFGTFRVGWHPDWQTRWSLQYKDRISPYPLMWDGGSPSYYGTGNSANNRADGQEIDLQNWVFMARDALKLNPNFWVEFSVWDGEDAPPEIATKWSVRNGWVEGRKDQYYKSLGLAYTPQHYAGYAQFGLWVLRPRMARWFTCGYDQDWNALKPDFMALCDSVGRVHRDPVLRDWWRKGELVPNTTTPSPWSQAMAGPFEKEHRWFVLDTDVNPTFDPVKYGIDYSQTKYEVFSFALTRGGAGSRQWLVYAYSPERHHSRVKLKIPRYSRTITVDAPVGGAFYEVDERSGAVTFLPPPESLATFASARTGAPASVPAPATAVTPTTAPAGPPRDLFNGHDASGWTGPGGVAAADSWQVTGTTFSATRKTTLWSEEMFGDCELEIEWKVEPGGNGGVFYLVNGASELSSPEMQLTDPASAGATQSGGLYRLEPPKQDASKPVGEWNTARLVVRSPRREHWINGEMVCAYEADYRTPGMPGALTTSGKLVLQANGAAVSYRNAKIRLIGATAPGNAPAAPAPAAPVVPSALPQVPADPQLAALHAAWTARFDAEANKPFEASIAALNAAYLRALDNARAAAKNNGALNEVLAIDAEIEQIKTAAMPAADGAGTPPALATLRKTWHETRAGHAAEREAKLTQLRAQYAQAIDALVVDLTKANQIEEAKRAQAFRESLAGQKPVP